MANIYRLVSPEKLEIYDFKKNDRLRLRKSVDPSAYNFKKVRHLILSAYYSNWDIIRIENTAYQPNEGAFLFSSKIAFDIDKMFMSAPFCNNVSGVWAQAWCPKILLTTKLTSISSQTKVYAEGVSVLSKASGVFWRSGPVILSNTEHTGFTERYSEEEIKAPILENIDGFEFVPRAPLVRFRKQKLHILILASLGLMASLLFSWELSVKDAVLMYTNPPVYFQNQIFGIDILSTTQSLVSDGSLDKVTFDQRAQQTILAFTSDDKAKVFFELVLGLPEALANWSPVLNGSVVSFDRKVGL